MARFTVNGTTVSPPDDRPLLPYLREELGLTSVKDGCSQGACGTCTVLVDGKALRACLLTAAKVDGKTVVTCEGLTATEREAYATAFARAGAVQCGFCTPGMVMAAKGLLDVEPSPTRAAAAKALRGNLCRCTGYKKIIDAVLLAGALLRGQAPPVEPGAALGERLTRVDAVAKTLGEAHYAADFTAPGMLIGGALRSAHPRAVVKAIDVAAARALSGVVRVVTADELPGATVIGHLKKDQPVLVGVGETTHFLGDPIVLIAAESRAILEEARRLVKVDYEPLPGVFSITEARAEQAPLVHEATPGNLLSREHLVRGDADAKLAASAHVVTQFYSTPPTEHAFLEPETALALPDGDGILIHSGDQGICQTRHECAEALGLPEEKVRVIAAMVGGGFGGKEDMSVQHHAAVLAHLTGRPVRVTLTRDESILVHPKRHGMELEFTTGCDTQGQLTAMKAVIRSDTGAVASLGGPVLQRACTHAAGPYNYQDIDIIGEAYYTNNPPAGAFRGFGVAQSCFAIECNLNLLAEKVGLSPFEFRLKNAIRPGQVLPNGQIADDTTALVETLEAVREYYEAHPKAGIACAMKNSGLGVGIPDVGRARLVIKNGVVEIHSSAACIGQGLGTVLTQILCTTADLAPEQVAYQAPDTATAPDAGNTTASRQTVFTGEAVHQAALALAAALEQSDLAALEGREFLGEYAGVTDKLGSDKENPVSHVAYGYATHLVDLDEAGRVSVVLAAHDVGRAVNPLSLEGQIEGGVVMSLGYALTEDFPLKEGRPTAKYGTLGLLRADQVPEVRPIIVERSQSELACGAKGVGEICSIPTAPAAQLAYYNRDGKFRTRLPLEDTPHRPLKK